MEKNIYDLLNQVETNVNNYELNELTQKEKDKILNNDILKHKLFKETKKMKNTNKKIKSKMIASAACAVIVTTTALGGVSAFATTNPVAHSIANILGITNNLSDYSTVVNQAQTKEDITISLNEAIYDGENNKFIVSTSVTSENSSVEENTIWAPHLRLYIDGENINSAQQTATKQIDDNTFEFVNVFMLKDKFEGDMDINLKVAGVSVNDEYIKESWEFEFSTNGDELSQNTYTEEIQLPVIIGGAEEIVIERINVNPVSTSIFYSTEILNGKSFKVKGVDNLGNVVEFHSAPIVEGGYGGELLIDSDEYTLTDNVESFTLQVFTNKTIEGELVPFYPVSEEFVVNIK